MAYILRSLYLDFLYTFRVCVLICKVLFLMYMSSNCFNCYSCPGLKWLLLYLGQHLTYQEFFFQLVCLFIVSDLTLLPSFSQYSILIYHNYNYLFPFLLKSHKLLFLKQIWTVAPKFSTNLIQCYCTNLQMVQLPITNICTSQFLQHFISSFPFFVNHYPTHC